MGSCNRSFIEIHNVQSQEISNKVEKIGIFPIECQSESQAQVLFGVKTSLGLNRMLTSYSHNKTMHLLEFPNSGFPLDLENLEKGEYTWKTWKYHGILKNLINIMEKWHETWKNLVATKNLPLTPLKQYKIH